MDVPGLDNNLVDRFSLDIAPEIGRYHDQEKAAAKDTLKFMEDVLAAQQLYTKAIAKAQIGYTYKGMEKTSLSTRWWW